MTELLNNEEILKMYPERIHIMYFSNLLILSMGLVATVQLLGCVWLFVMPWTSAHQTSLSFTISWNLLKLMSIEWAMPSNRLILCPPLLLPSVFPSIRALSNELSLCIRCPKYWSFHFNTSTSNEYSEFIFFRIDWIDLSVRRTLKSLLQPHSLKASVILIYGFSNPGLF